MEKLWTTVEVAQYLGVTEADVEQLVHEGRLTGYKLGGQFLRFRPDQVTRLRGAVKPRAQGAAAAAAALPTWKERLSDFLYFNDFYLLSGGLFFGLLLYLLLSR